MPLVTLINPPISGQEGDPHTGIPFMPFILAYLAAVLDQAGYPLEVVDAFGEQPRRSYRSRGKVVWGLTPAEIVEAVAPATAYVFVYARAVQDHELILETARQLRRRYPEMTVIVIENSQAVTSFSLRFSLARLFPDVDYAIVGECEAPALELLAALERGEPRPDVGGVARRDEAGAEGYRMTPRDGPPFDLDQLPAPRWEDFPLESYWDLKVGHGPISGRYLTLLSSRGCPYPCTFCVVPDMTGRRWRGKSPSPMADEIETLVERFGVRELHFEDLNSTVSRKRIVELCDEIVRRRLDVTWKLVSGIKIETVDEATIERMAAAGCRYVSFSPESGSPRVLKMMKKGFDHPKALRLTRLMARLGIHTQACFILGYPGETAEDRALTAGFVKTLVRHGVKEIALFIFTPVPGSQAFDLIDGYGDWSELSFSPVWRKDYRQLARFRRGLYLKFAVWKLIWQPLEVARHLSRVLCRRFETKMEMVAYRVLSQLVWRRRSAEP
jgi:Radical SAM superfamily